MKSTGTAVAAVLFAVLAGFFVYQSWFSPTRKIQRRLNDIAAALSAPDQEPPMTRMTRAAQLRKYLAADVRIEGDHGDLPSREAIVAAVAGLTPPPGGWNVQFVDVQIRLDRSTNTSADVNLTVEINGRDPRTGQPTVDTRAVAATVRKQDGEWVVATAETRP